MDAQGNPIELEKLSQLAKGFLQTEYGQILLSDLSRLCYGYHEQAEAATTPEATFALIKQASGVRDAINMITKTAEAEEHLKVMEAADTFDRVRTQ